MADPSTIGSGLNAWFKADAITGTTNGSTISSWVDSSPSASTTDSPFSTYNPKYNTSVLNSLPVVSFHWDGTDDSVIRVTSAVTSLPAQTLFVVITPSNVSTYGEIWHGDNGALLLRINGSGQLELVRIGSAIICAGSTTLSAGTTYIASAQYADLGTCNLYLNGTLDATATSASALASTTYSYIGADGVFGSFGFQGNIAEVISYNNVLSSTDHTSVISYLQTKYGLGSGGSLIGLPWMRFN